jgi:DNA-directed RNA polymerase subunit RPC12/RpoP
MGDRYRCNNCNYKFEQKSERVPDHCPYCAEKDIMKETEYFNVNKELEQ